MITIKQTDYYPILFKELKPGDIFYFFKDPHTIYIKTDDNFCVTLETGNLFKGNPFEEVVLYRKAELSLER